MPVEDAVPETPPPKANPIASGQAFIGLCNTRGIALQLYTQRALQALFVNLAGLATVTAWLGGERSKYLLLACGIGVLAFGSLIGLGIRTIRGSAKVVDLWTNKLIELEQTNRLDGDVKIYSSPEYSMLRSQPALSANHLIAVMYVCILGWGIVGLAALTMYLKMEGIDLWNMLSGLVFRSCG